MPACDGAFTGATCDLPCTSSHEPTPGSCGVDPVCHADGRLYALSTRNALLYPASPDAPDATIEAELEAWIVEHPADLGLAAGLTVDDLELQRLPHFRASAGPLTLFRFGQTYRGRPVLAPDGIVTLVHAPRGAVTITGAVVDGRTPYAHADVQASQDHAVRSLLAHASDHSGIAIDELEVVHATAVAMPGRRAVGWAGLVRKHAGGSMVARVIVDADPTFSGAVLPLWSYRALVVADLADAQPVVVRSLETSGDLTSLGYTDQTTRTTGVSLFGSVDDASQEIQLANERVVVLDLHGMLEDDLITAATRVTDPAGEFLAETSTELSAQIAYHLFQSWYDLVDERLTDPVTGAKRWDSANDVYSNGTYPSDTPPGTYAPRVLAFVGANAADCPANATACAMESGYRAGNAESIAFPELVHFPPGASNQETTGNVMLPGEDVEPITLAHEFGHIVDIFAGGGIIKDVAPDCNGPCALECVENTTDEAAPLTETVAQLLAFVLLRQSFDGVHWQHCSIVDMISRNGDKPWTPGPCVPAGEDISLFQRPDACAKPGPYCDKPEDPGFEPHCCFDDQDLGDCTLVVPAQCPVGATSSSGGMGTGTARPVPTGMCEARQGYATNSIFQAFWQLLNGQRCDPTPPFACVSAAWPPGVDPVHATTDALLYALRVNSLTYQQLFDSMATYVSCTYGATAYEEFNTVACNHGLRDCALPAPMLCKSCGNGVREVDEDCDGTDWKYASCDAMPQYSGGTLTCDPATCMFDESQCSMPGLDTTAGTVTSGQTATTGDSTTGGGLETATETDPGAAGAGSDGCDCQAGPWKSVGLALFVIPVLGAGRRRRAA